MDEYAHPETVVGTGWVADHASDPNVRILEVDYDPSANYALGHIPGSHLVDWRHDLNDPLTRDIVGPEGLRAVLERVGATDSSTLVLYGDFNNWFAAFAFWILKYYRFSDVRLMDGGRKKWFLEDRPITKEVPVPAPGRVDVPRPLGTIRAYYDDVLAAIDAARSRASALVDVRGPKEFTGEVLAPPEYPTEHAQRGGHIPGAKNIPWGLAVNEDGTFKSRPELERLYREKGVVPDVPVITYCRIGERSSHTWFVLTYLLGYPNVRNYDGSWTEWGNRIRSPVERP
jgi:thiosulfate/3-mercaptopyruvate sulfurtransferase